MLAVFEKIQELSEDIATLKSEFALMRITAIKLRADLEEDAELYDDKFRASADELDLLCMRLAQVESELAARCNGCIFNRFACGSRNT